jgi:cytochrome c oxidase subunit IV
MEHSKQPTHSTSVYYIVYAVLMVLLVATVGVHYLHWGVWGTVAALSIATVKALLVVLYFMHVRYSSSLVAVFAASGFFILFILLGLLLSDYFTRAWLR